MGKKIVTKTNTKTSTSHPAGAKVTWLQPVYGEHGNMHTKRYRLWTILRADAEELYIQLNELQLQINQINPSAINGFRELHDEAHNDLMEAYIKAGYKFIESIYLMFQDLTSEVIGHFLLPGEEEKYKEINGRDLNQKLEYVCKIVLEDKALVGHSGYIALFSEFEIRRHALNHPDAWNTYNASDNDWDKVPLAWLLSGRYKKNYERIDDLLEILMPAIEKKYKELERPGTITAVRGIVSGRGSNIIQKR
jgi:L-rhamnose mutarotase